MGTTASKPRPYAFSAPSSAPSSAPAAPLSPASPFRGAPATVESPHPSPSPAQPAHPSNQPQRGRSIDRVNQVRTHPPSRQASPQRATLTRIAERVIFHRGSFLYDCAPHFPCIAEGFLYNTPYDFVLTGVPAVDHNNRSKARLQATTHRLNARVLRERPKREREVMEQFGQLVFDHGMEQMTDEFARLAVNDYRQLLVNTERLAHDNASNMMVQMRRNAQYPPIPLE